MPHVEIGTWEIVLLVAVSAQATTLAYMHEPKWKALLLSLPIPFTVASMSLGRPIDATNVVAMTVLLVYTHAVRLLHQELRVPIVPSIVLAVLGYCALGAALASRLPAGDGAFWLACGLTVVLGGVLYFVTSHRDEPGHRSPLPVWLKLPLVALVILGLIVIKKSLGGFMTMFPMVGVVAAYEARHSLWTISRQIPVLMLTMVPFMVVCRLLHGKIGLGMSLPIAWVVFLAILVPFTRLAWAADARGLKSVQAD